MSKTSIKHAVKKYRNNTVIPDLNALVKDRELFTLLGSSGCRKTAPFRTIADSNFIEGGDICFNDTRINDMDPSKRNISMVLQNYAISPNVTVCDNVAFGLKNRKMDGDRIKEQTNKYLNLMQIMQRTERMPNQLSGDQQQRAALVGALIIMPDVFPMDEPLSNLDTKLRLEMGGVIHHTQENANITAVCVIYDQEEATAISDTIAVMKDDMIQHVDSSKDIYQRLRNVLVTTFIGRTSIVFIKVEQGAVISSSGYRVGLDCLGQAEDQEVLYSIRPEESVISPGESEGTRGVVEEYTHLGLNTYYPVETEDHMTVETVEGSSIEDELKPSQRVLLQVKEHETNLFDEEGSVNLVRSEAYEG